MFPAMAALRHAMYGSCRDLPKKDVCFAGFPREPDPGPFCMGVIYLSPPRNITSHLPPFAFL